jgi:hypothetical protein
MDKEFLDRIMNTPDLLQMGHDQTPEDRNLGMGWLYYSLSRLYRPKKNSLYWSWRGFVPMLLAERSKR